MEQFITHLQSIMDRSPTSDKTIYFEWLLKFRIEIGDVVLALGGKGIGKTV